MYLGILNRLGVTHEFNRRTDEWTDTLIANVTFNYAVWPKTETCSTQLIITTGL